MGVVRRRVRKRGRRGVWGDEEGGVDIFPARGGGSRWLVLAGEEGVLGVVGVVVGVVGLLVVLVWWCGDDEELCGRRWEGKNDEG